MTPGSEARAFNSPWPVVLAEMLDFAGLVRLRTGGTYTALYIRVGISRGRVAPEALASPEFRAFRAALAALPKSSVHFEAVDHPAHYLIIDIK